MLQTTKLQLSGLTCGACERVISNRLRKIEGVTQVQVSAQNGSASIIASRSISKDEMIHVLLDTHYNVINIL